MISLLVVLVVLLAYLVFYRLVVQKMDVVHHPVSSWGRIGFLLSLGRLGILWTLLLLAWLEKLQMWHLVWTVFLLPEALLVPIDIRWNPGTAVLASAGLTAGSFLLSFFLVQTRRLLSRE